MIDTLELINLLAPEHRRTTCGDGNPFNGFTGYPDLPDCPRCALLEAAGVHNGAGIFGVPDHIKMTVKFERNYEQGPCGVECLGEIRDRGVSFSSCTRHGRNFHVLAQSLQVMPR